MAKKLSKQEIISRLNKIDWIEFDENTIVDYNTHFTVKCKKCGNVYKSTPSNLFKGTKCRQCYNNSLKGHDGDRVFNKLKERYKNVIDFSNSVYETTKKPLKCKCKLCGEEFNLNVGHAINEVIQHPCPHCRKIQTSLEYKETFIKKLNEKFNYKFDCSKVKYVNTRTPVTLICKTCKTEFEAVPQVLLGSNCYIGCPNCKNKIKSEKRMKTTEQFIEQAKEIYGDIYDYSESVYKGELKPIKIICKEHGPFITLPKYHLRKHGGGTCPKCYCSSGELRVMNILEKLKIPYIFQFQIKSEKFSNIKKYVFMDFLLSKNSQIMFIEFNGEQHYRPVDKFGGEEVFEKQLVRDQEVKEYCKENNYPLLIIPYNCSNNDIEKLIKQFYGIYQSETTNN